ncbi:hypothetical protein Pelo_2963 [Pelomyxa schiedti]|nr:hypothetical protein Pelo_2963 [Pelomyxa schiedti]
MPFQASSRFGNDFLTKFQASMVNVPILEDLTIIDTPEALFTNLREAGYNDTRTYTLLKKIGDHTWLTTAEDSGEPRVKHEDNLIPWHDPDKAPLIPKAIGPEAVIHGKVIEEILEHKEVPGGMLYLMINMMAMKQMHGNGIHRLIMSAPISRIAPRQ